MPAGQSITVVDLRKEFEAVKLNQKPVHSKKSVVLSDTDDSTELEEIHLI